MAASSARMSTSRPVIRALGLKGEGRGSGGDGDGDDDEGVACFPLLFAILDAVDVVSTSADSVLSLSLSLSFPMTKQSTEQSLLSGPVQYTLSVPPNRLR